jgi:hypothetical protein
MTSFLSHLNFNTFLRPQYADLDGELTEKLCAILYELIQVTQQARWPLAKKTAVSPTWLADALAADTAMVSPVRVVCGWPHPHYYVTTPFTR